MEENLRKEKINEFFEQLLDVVVNFANTFVEVVKTLLATIIDVLEMFRMRSIARRSESERRTQEES